MRDFYDLYVLENTQSHNINSDVLRAAFFNTSKNRGSYDLINTMNLILDEVKNDANMINLWENYQRKFDYATDIEWNDIMRIIYELCEKCVLW